MDSQIRQLLFLYWLLNRQLHHQNLQLSTTTMERQSILTGLLLIMVEVRSHHTPLKLDRMTVLLIQP